MKQTPRSLFSKGEPSAGENQTGVALKVSGSRPGAGDTLGVQVTVTASPSVIAGEGQLLPPPAGGQTSTLNLTMSSEGGWMRFDFPSGIGSSHPATVLVRVQSATVDR